MWSSADENAHLAQFGSYNDGSKPATKTLSRADHERLAQQRLHGSAIKLARAAESGCCYIQSRAPDYLAAALHAKRLAKLATLCAEAAAGEHTWLMAEALWDDFTGEKSAPPSVPASIEAPKQIEIRAVSLESGSSVHSPPADRLTTLVPSSLKRAAT